MRRTHLSIAIQCAINAPPREYMLWHLGQQLEITTSVAEAVEMEVRDFAKANRIKADAP